MAENEIAFKCPLCSWNSAAEGLCIKCERRLHSQLADLLELWDEAHDQLQPGKGSGGGRSTERTIGLNVNALSFIQGADIKGVLHEWEKFVRSALSLTKPALIAKPETLREEIKDTVAFMQIHLQFLGATDYIGDFANELKELHSLGMTAAKRFTEKATRIACPADREDGLPCGTMLKIHEEQKADPLSHFTCRGCKTEWTTKWLVQVALSTPGAHFWMDIESICKWQSLTRRDFHRLVKKHEIPKRGTLYDAVSIRNIEESA